MDGSDCGRVGAFCVAARPRREEDAVTLAVFFREGGLVRRATCLLSDSEDWLDDWLDGWLLFSV
jgi:hypothetical protein